MPTPGGIVDPMPEDEQRMREILAGPDGMDGRGKLDALLKLVRQTRELGTKEAWDFVAAAEDWSAEEIRAKARWEKIQIEEDLT